MAFRKYNCSVFVAVVTNRCITSAKVLIGLRLIQDVFSIIESRFPDALIVSEKGFGNLDELDIDNFAKTSTGGESYYREDDCYCGQ